MFILISIAINSSFTSKGPHVCILAVIVASLKVSYDSSCFSSSCALGFPGIREMEKGLEPLFHCLRERKISLFIDIISKISTVGM
ncbi:hypothetical protein HKD37_18G050077 [Glycine soja]